MRKKRCCSKKKLLTIGVIFNLDLLGYFKYSDFFIENFNNVFATDYLDFTGSNSITNNKNNYWDSSHLRIEETKVIMAKLFKDPLFKGYEDFGVFVTPNNIELHLKKQRDQYKKINLNKILN